MVCEAAVVRRNSACVFKRLWQNFFATSLHASTVDPAARCRQQTASDGKVRQCLPAGGVGKIHDLYSSEYLVAQSRV